MYQTIYTHMHMVSVKYKDQRYSESPETHFSFKIFEIWQKSWGPSSCHFGKLFFDTDHCSAENCKGEMNKIWSERGGGGNQLETIK